MRLTATLVQPEFLCVREFLDAPSSSSSAHIIATVNEGEGTLTIGDGHQHVTLDFPMVTEAEKVASGLKLDLFSAAVASFVKACRRQLG